MMFIKLKKYVILYAILAFLSGCTTNINGDYCLLYEPIYADYEADTADTIKQIDKNNIVYENLCKIE